jgi:hypothetical protein
MNRRERRRQSMMVRQNKFFEDHIRHLTEAGPEVLGKPGINHMVMFHDPKCTIYDDRGCSC